MEEIVTSIAGYCKLRSSAIGNINSRYPRHSQKFLAKLCQEYLKMVTVYREAIFTGNEGDQHTNGFQEINRD